MDPGRFQERLIASATDGRQLPFRYFSAYKAVQELSRVAGAGKVLDAIEDCLNHSLGELPRFPGRLMALADNSGSGVGSAGVLLTSGAIGAIASAGASSTLIGSA